MVDSAGIISIIQHLSTTSKIASISPNFLGSDLCQNQRFCKSIGFRRYYIWDNHVNRLSTLRWTANILLFTFLARAARFGLALPLVVVHRGAFYFLRTIVLEL